MFVHQFHVQIHAYPHVHTQKYINIEFYLQTHVDTCISISAHVNIKTQEYNFVNRFLCTRVLITSLPLSLRLKSLFCLLSLSMYYFVCLSVFFSVSVVVTQTKNRCLVPWTHSPWWEGLFLGFWSNDVRLKIELRAGITWYWNFSNETHKCVCLWCSSDVSACLCVCSMWSRDLMHLCVFKWRAKIINSELERTRQTWQISTKKSLTKRSEEVDKVLSISHVL